MYSGYTLSPDGVIASGPVRVDEEGVGNSVVLRVSKQVPFGEQVLDPTEFVVHSAQQSPFPWTARSFSNGDYFSTAEHGDMALARAFERWQYRVADMMGMPSPVLMAAQDLLSSSKKTQGGMMGVDRTVWKMLQDAVLRATRRKLGPDLG